MIPTPVPDGSVAHSVGRKREDSTDDCTDTHVIPYEETVSYHGSYLRGYARERITKRL